MKAFIRVLLRIFYRFRVFDPEALKTPGPALLVPNHVSWLDWLFLYAVLDDDWRFVATTTTAEVSWLHRKIVYHPRTFPIDPSSPHAVREMAEHLERGGRLVLFAEGRISMTGSLMKLFEGTGFLIRKTNAKVITCYLCGAERIRWVRHPGWREWFPRVSAHFSPALTAPSLDHVSHSEARQRLTQWLRDQMVEQQFQVEQRFGATNVLAAVAETTRHIPGRIALEDVTGGKLTYRRLMIATDLLGAQWPRRLGSPARVGVLLPNINAMPVTLLSLWSAGKVPTILNFSSGVPTMLACAQLAGLKQVVTSRAFLDRSKLDLAPFAAAGVDLVYLEDVRVGVSSGAKLAAFLRHVWAPGAKFRRKGMRGEVTAPTMDEGGNSRGVVTAPTLDEAKNVRGEGSAPTAAEGCFEGEGRGAHATAVVLFTSGSESAPKGVELTHGNLLANVRQALAAMDLTDNDRFLNALPLFHSFGLTAGTLLPLVRGCYTFLYPSPLHYRIVPAMVYDRNCTVLLATNTFLRGYARRSHPYDFRTIRYLIAGAEKVQEATIDVWAKKFGVRVLEGYGATECSPVVSVNTWVAPNAGSAGRFLPGIEHRLEPVEGITEGGRLLVRGPNVMQGYLNADANARFQALGGWYDTGDIASVDANGFLHLLGRLKRFAKVSGEMVSLTAVEDGLAGAFPQYGPRCEIAVLARADPDRGESLVAVTNEARLQFGEIRAVLRAKGFSNLAMPRDVSVVRTIPKLGTGKIDHRELAKVFAAAIT
ncbi:MAG TPA: AMP-binding protein [Opitutaceae bacterium]|nr:AMP-binding protein [Opitutaceae bacterium]